MGIDYYKINFNYPYKSYCYLKSYCALRGVSMTQWIKEAIRLKMDMEKKEK
jgi:hypothetical protein